MPGFPPLVPHNQDDFDNDWRRAQRRSRWSTVAAVVGGLLFAGALIWLASRFLT